MAPRKLSAWSAMQNFLRGLNCGDELVVASCIQAAEALVALGMRIQDVGAKEKKEALKLGKKVVWDIHLWRCTGKVWAWTLARL